MFVLQGVPISFWSCQIDFMLLKRIVRVCITGGTTYFLAVPDKFLVAKAHRSCLYYGGYHLFLGVPEKFVGAKAHSSCPYYGGYHLFSGLER